LNNSKGLRRIVIGGMIFSMIMTVALMIQILFGPNQVPRRIGIVTPEQVCSEIGADMIRDGGNSIDAYIASSLCLSVVNPFAAGFGAGGFLLVRDHKREHNLALNCFLRTSEDLNENDYINSPIDGIDSVAIPGEFKCLQTVYHKYSKLYWKVLVKPAINLAVNGFTVSKLLAQHLKKLEDPTDHNFSKMDLNMKDVFIVDGKLATEGMIIKNERLAKTFETLSHNEDSLYSGSLSIDLIDDLTKDGQRQLTANDLKSYSAQDQQETTLVAAEYQDFVLLTSSFPSLGPVLKIVLGAMSELKVKIDDFTKPEYYKNLLEAVQASYIMSSYLTDTMYSQDTANFFIEQGTLIQKGFSTNDTKIQLEIKEKQLEDDITVNFININDHNDLMVSYVGTLGSSWGSRVMTKSGIILNNGINMFSFGQDINSIGPNRQPRALMAPILTYNSKSPCVRRFGISYSHNGHHFDDYALSELTQVIVKLFTDSNLYGSTLEDKRVQYVSENKVCYEEGFDGKIREALNGSKFKNVSPDHTCSFHSVDLVMKTDHIIYSKVDSRSQDGTVVFNKD
jgi:gamma-glutamyltranspeptidase